jgi:sensor histidine kinase YesM
MNTKFVIILSLIFSINFVFAQQFNFTNVGTSKGLPSSECYGMMQDSKGYMWIRTLNGLCKFDGKKFKIFTKKEGLKSNAIYVINEDKKQRIWFATSSSHIGYIYNDSIYYLPSSEAFAKENGYGQKVFYQIAIDEKFNVLVSSHERAYKFNADTEYKTYDLYTQNDYYINIVEINKQPFCIPDTVSKLRELQKRQFKFSVFGHQLELFWDETTIRQGIIRMTYPCKDNKGNVFFHFNNRLYFLNRLGALKEYTFENLIYHVFIDKENNLWIGLNSRGLLMFPDANINLEPKRMLEEETVSGINQDFEGGLWVSTLNKGLFYCKNLFNENLVNDTRFNYKPEMLKIIEGKMFISDFKSGIVKLDIPKSTVFYKKMSIDKTQIGILDIDKVSDGFILSGRNCLYKLDNDFNFKEKILWDKKLNLSAGSYNTIVTSKKQIIGISKNYFTNYTDNFWYKLPSFGNDILEVDENIFVATKNGLMLFDEKLKDKFKVLIRNENIIKLLLIDHNLFAFCRDGKVFKFDNQLKSKKYNLGNVSINDACYSDVNTLILASNTGIYFLNLLDGKIKLLNTSDGILDNEVFKIAIFNNMAYYSTNYGIGRFALDKVKNNLIAPKIFLASAKSNENKGFNPSFIYPYNSSFTFNFDIITFKDGGPLKLTYKLAGYNKEWNSNESGEVTYTNLTDGTYSLLVYATNSAGVKSKVMQLPILIEKPFFKSAWFLLLLIAMLVLLAYVIYKITYHFINKREVNKTKVNKLLAEYQLMGLKAQMNPHFIFNCLNSIQKYVLEHDTKQAYTYMAKFSKLIRFVLDISDKTFVALSDELELVKIYVELEQLRFDKKFEFVIELNENIEPDEIVVPSLLIQPYLENAIWHGIMNLPDHTKGEVKIKASIINQHIEIEIKDNGIGRKRAKMLTQKNHQSKGMSINQKRIEAINYLLKTHNATIEIVDMLDADGEALGTKVIIKLPLKYDE